MKEASSVTARVSSRSEHERPVYLHAVDCHAARRLLDRDAAIRRAHRGAACADGCDSSPSAWKQPVRRDRSMTGARSCTTRSRVRLESCRRCTEVKAAPLACKTDKIERAAGRAVLARSWQQSGCRTRRRRERESRVPCTGPPPHDAEEPHPRDADDLGIRPVSDRRPRRPERLTASRSPIRAPQRRREPQLIDDLELQIAGSPSSAPPGADHRYIPRWSPRPARLDQRLHRRLRDRDIERSPRPPSWRLHRPARASISPAPATGAARSQSRLTLPRWRCEAARTPQPPRLRRALPAHQEAPGPPARPQGRPDRPLEKAHRAMSHSSPATSPRPGSAPFV